jgi:plasmid stabilization system protein ParE
MLSPAAIRDLQRPRDLPTPKNPLAARRAGETILAGVRTLGMHPHMGRLIEDLPEQYREWLIDFADTGYMVRYRLNANTVTILAVRHRKEAMF